MTFYKRKKYWWVKFSQIKGELKPFFKSTGTGTGLMRDAQKYHDKLQAERWEMDKLGVKPKHTLDEAASKFLEETGHKRTHDWDKSMLRWFQLLLGGQLWMEINTAGLGGSGRWICAAHGGRAVRAQGALG